MIQSPSTNGRIAGLHLSLAQHSTQSPPPPYIGTLYTPAEIRKRDVSLCLVGGAGEDAVSNQSHASSRPSSIGTHTWTSKSPRSRELECVSEKAVCTIAG